MELQPSLIRSGPAKLDKVLSFNSLLYFKPVVPQSLLIRSSAIPIWTEASATFCRKTTLPRTLSLPKFGKSEQYSPSFWGVLAWLVPKAHWCYLLPTAGPQPVSWFFHAAFSSPPTETKILRTAVLISLNSAPCPILKMFPVFCQEGRAALERLQRCLYFSPVPSSPFVCTFFFFPFLTAVLFFSPVWLLFSHSLFTCFSNCVTNEWGLEVNQEYVPASLASTVTLSPEQEDHSGCYDSLDD